MPAVNDVGEPCAGEPHARFDGRGLETEQPGHGHGSEAARRRKPGKSGTGPNARPRHRASPRPYISFPRSFRASHPCIILMIMEALLRLAVD
jgi:hypothetical protein